MGSAVAFIPLVFLALIFLVFLPLPIYVGGKIAKVTSEKFSYGSCIWTGLAGGIASGILSGIIGMGLKTFLSGNVYLIIYYVISLAVSVVVFGYFFRKHYLMDNKQIAIVWVSMIVLGIVIGVIVKYLSAALGIILIKGM